jgi:hypothetical protein
MKPWKGDRNIFCRPFQGFAFFINTPGVPLRFTPGYFLNALPGRGII